MELTPKLYQWLVRPKWLTRHYIHNKVSRHVDLKNQHVLDFGAGVGSNSLLCHPDRYIGLECNPERVALAGRLNPDYRFLSFQSGEPIPLSDHTVDIVMVIAVLHHIPPKQLDLYIQEFYRVLRPKGRVIALEPYLCSQHRVSNRLMKWLDRGQFIQFEQNYLEAFHGCQFETKVLQRFKKCMIYNEVLFHASPVQYHHYSPSFEMPRRDTL